MASSTETDRFGIEKGYYDRVFHKSRGIQSKWHHLKFKGIQTILSSIQYRRLLDTGCGPGTFLATLSRSAQTMGMDVSLKQIGYARRSYRNRHRSFICASAERLPFGNNCFQLITALEFIEHLTMASCGKLLLEAHRCLEPGGFVLLTTPNYDSLWPLLEWALSSFSEVDYRKQHISRFTHSKIVSLLIDNGF